MIRRRPKSSLFPYATLSRSLIWSDYSRQFFCAKTAAVRINDVAEVFLLEQADRVRISLAERHCCYEHLVHCVLHNSEAQRTRRCRPGLRKEMDRAGASVRARRTLL